MGLRVLWGLVRNPPLRWRDTATGEVWLDRVSRTERWHITRPMWTYSICTRKQQPCGCRNRWWGTRVWICSDHAFPEEE